MSKFALRPRKGDVWEYTDAKGRKIRKTVSMVLKQGGCYNYAEGERVCIRPPRLLVWWERQPRGRYSAVSVHNLLRRGKLITRP